MKQILLYSIILILLTGIGINADAKQTDMPNAKSTIAVVPLQSPANEFTKEELESYSEHLKSKLSDKKLYIFVDSSDSAKKIKT